MFRIKVFIFHSLFTLFLTGCVNIPINTSTYDANEFSKGKKAIVVLRSTYIFNTALRGLVKKKAISSWKKENSRYSFKVNGLCFIPFTDTVSDTPEYEIQLIEPGKYYLEPYSMYNMNGGHSVTFNPHVFFEVKAGDVVYIGDLYINADCLSFSNCSKYGPQVGTNCGKISLKNTFEEARQFLKKQYPELADRFTVNLMSVDLF